MHYFVTEFWYLFFDSLCKSLEEEYSIRWIEDDVFELKIPYQTLIMAYEFSKTKLKVDIWLFEPSDFEQYLISEQAGIISKRIGQSTSPSDGIKPRDTYSVAIVNETHNGHRVWIDKPMRYSSMKGCCCYCKAEHRIWPCTIKNNIEDLIKMKTIYQPLYEQYLVLNKTSHDKAYGRDKK